MLDLTVAPAARVIDADAIHDDFRGEASSPAAYADWAQDWASVTTLGGTLATGYATPEFIVIVADDAPEPDAFATVAIGGHDIDLSLSRETVMVGGQVVTAIVGEVA